MPKFHKFYTKSMQLNPPQTFTLIMAKCVAILLHVLISNVRFSYSGHCLSTRFPKPVESMNNNVWKVYKYINYILFPKEFKLTCGDCVERQILTILCAEVTVEKTLLKLYVENLASIFDNLITYISSHYYQNKNIQNVL